LVRRFFVIYYFISAILLVRVIFGMKLINVLGQFLLEQSFCLDGISHGDVTEQCLRRTHFFTEYSFPSMKYRLKIVKKEMVCYAC
jgi:hypothetical protein